MFLKKLIENLPDVERRGGRDLEVHSLCDDSRLVQPGALFIARKGALEDGAKWIPQAIDAGAVAIVTDLYNPFVKVAQVISPYPEKLIPLLASRFYDFPSRSLQVFGVTGTKGKTTTCYFLAHLLKKMGKETGLMTTVETMVGPYRFTSSLTTHSVIHNHKKLAEMRQAGCEAAVLEVSSHGLDQGRVDEIDFSIGILTNFSADHLDYHKTVEAYAEAKRKLFLKSRRVVLNGDSPWSHFMKGDQETLSYGFEEKNDLRATHVERKNGKIHCKMGYRGEEIEFRSPWIGRFNLYNAMAAIGAGLLLGGSLEKIGAILEKAPDVPGRLERVPNSKGLRIFVDYAHTGPALDEVLSNLREAPVRKLVVVFGCGGGRDPTRRKAMAQAAEKWADLILVTSDNPRGEDPEEIMRQILAGFAHREKVHVEMDRKKAIELAVAQISGDDILLIAGKGHEKYQIFAHHTIPFDDVAVAKEAVQCV